MKRRGLAIQRLPCFQKALRTSRADEYTNQPKLNQWGLLAQPPRSQIFLNCLALRDFDFLWPDLHLEPILDWAAWRTGRERRTSARYSHEIASCTEWLFSRRKTPIGRARSRHNH